jgi:hypothetical protein
MHLSRDFELVVDHKIISKDSNDIIRDLSKVKDYLLKGFPTDIDFIEHTSANPVSRLHIGNIFGGLVGDTLCRLFNMQGYYYVNDIGVNFCKFIGSRSNIDQVIKDIQIAYSTTQCTPARLEILRKQLYTQGLSQEDIRLRSKALEIIEEDLSQANIKPMTYVYESSYANHARALMNELSDSGKDYTINNIRIATSEGIPLYVLYDYFYRVQINKIYNNCVGVMGRDHIKHTMTLQKAMGVRPWTYFSYPVVKLNNEKLSKRLNNIVYYQDLVRSIQEHNSSYNVSDCKNLIRLKLLKYCNNDSLDLNMIHTDSHVFHKILQTQNVELIDKEISCNKLMEIWSNLDLVIDKCIRNKDLNIIFKFLERLYVLRKKETNTKNLQIHYELLNLFKNRLGLL